jgi:hypothetical protein
MIHLMKLSMIGLVAIASSACEKSGAAEQEREHRANAELQQAKNEATQRAQSAEAAGTAKVSRDWDALKSAVDNVQ